MPGSWGLARLAGGSRGRRTANALSQSVAASTTRVAFALTATPCAGGETTAGKPRPRATSASRESAVATSMRAASAKTATLLVGDPNQGVDLMADGRVHRPHLCSLSAALLRGPAACGRTEHQSARGGVATRMHRLPAMNRQMFDSLSFQLTTRAVAGSGPIATRPAGGLLTIIRHRKLCGSPRSAVPTNTPVGLERPIVRLSAGAKIDTVRHHHPTASDS